MERRSAKDRVKEAAPNVYQASVAVRRRLRRLWRLAQTIPGKGAVDFGRVLARAEAEVAFERLSKGEPGGERGDEPGGDRNRRIVMVVISELRIDPRVEREARTLAARGWTVRVLFPDSALGTDRWTPIDWGPGVDVRSLPFTARNYIDEFPWLLGGEMLEALLEEEPPFAYHCHDLNTCLVGLTAASLRGAHCVCDFHEWFSENVTWDGTKQDYVPHPPLKRAVYKRAEAFVLDHASEVITVSDSIAAGLVSKRSDGRSVNVVRNIPFLETNREDRGVDLRTLAEVDPGAFLVLYQGGVGPVRNLEPIVRAMALVEGAVLVIRGPGIDRYGEGYLALAEQSGARDRVRILPPVPSARVVAEARSADSGIWSLTDISLNFRCALPNKVFEYLAAGLPLIAANYPEVGKLVARYGVGVTFDPESPDSIARAIARLAKDRRFFEQCRANIPAALEDLRADAEWKKITAIYDRLEATTAPKIKQRGARRRR